MEDFTPEYDTALSTARYTKPVWETSTTFEPHRPDYSTKTETHYMRFEQFEDGTVRMVMGNTRHYSEHRENPYHYMMLTPELRAFMVQALLTPPN